MGYIKKLFSTLRTRGTMFTKNVNNSLRTADVIKEEIILTLEKIKAGKANEFKHAFLDIAKTYQGITDTIKTVDTRITDTTAKVREFKRQYLSTGNEEFKAQGIGYLNVLNKLQESKASLEEQRTQNRAQYDKLNKSLSTFNMTWNLKYAEAMAIVTNYSINKCSDVNINVDISELLNEFDLKVQELSITDMVDNALSDKSSNDCTDFSTNFADLESKFNEF